MPTTRKITLTLPTELVESVERMAPPGNYSQFIAEAVTWFIQELEHEALREELKAGYLATAEESKKLAEEWRPLEEEVWRKYVPSYEGSKEDQCPMSNVQCPMSNDDNLEENRI